MKEGRPSWTARWVAAQRAALAGGRPGGGDVDSERRLYEDLALPLLGTRLVAPSSMAVRTKFFDSQVLDASAQGIGQVVVLGAGYDGRPLRFNDLPLRWIEVDHPASQADKRRRLARVGAPTGNVRFAPVDLMADDLGAALEAAGHEAGDRTLWMAEGLLPYLPAESIRSLFETLRSRSAPGSSLVVNVLVMDRATTRSALVRGAVDKILAIVGEPRLASFREGDAERLLEESGWQIHERGRQAASRADGSYFLAVRASC